MALEGEGEGGGPPAKKAGWSKEEDERLREMVRQNKAKDWGVIAAAFPGRTDKSCRLRWRQHLDPSVDAQPFTPDEDRTIVELQLVHRNRWSTIAAFLPGRSDNAVKNRWNTHLRKRRAQDDGQQQQQQPLERAPACLPLFPLTPGFHHSTVRPMPVGENAPGPERSALPECLELFPLSLGDVMDNATGAAAMYVDTDGICSLTEMRLSPPAVDVDIGAVCSPTDTESRLAPATVVFDAMPLQAFWVE
ncbi:transcription factor MYB77-like [Oryza brachyantha]|uniref:transcription factor MYB77-like n=1 Tax=Oryza brachyantha TaxID=4533 RepID=UPI001ADB59FE|nr:transcription factor MYB77-like [Oryza brachyantha]